MMIELLPRSFPTILSQDLKDINMDVNLKEPKIRAQPVSNVYAKQLFHRRQKLLYHLFANINRGLYLIITSKSMPCG